MRPEPNVACAHVPGKGHLCCHSEGRRFEPARGICVSSKGLLKNKQVPRFARDDTRGGFDRRNQVTFCLRQERSGCQSKGMVMNSLSSSSVLGSAMRAARC